MKVFADADACPVIPEIIAVTKKQHIKVVLIKSYAHFSTEILDDHVETVYVDETKEAADFEIFRQVNKGDLVITQDYGLASLCLNKGCIVLHHRGFLYTERNIDRLLARRHFQQKRRLAGEKTRGPRKFTEEDRLHFIQSLQKVIERDRES